MTCNNANPWTLAAILVAATACGGGAVGPDAGTDEPDGGAHFCELADCRDGHARTCDQDPLTLDCTAFAGACADFVDVDGTPFAWCDCGPLADGEGECLGGRDGVTCEAGLGLIAECIPGTVCVVSPGDPFGLACECDGITDGVCPDAVCTNDSDCSTCTPSCGGAECGDNGCGGTCGSCPFGETCSGGQCQAICVPDCAGKDCGSDGCSGSCGTCDGTCTAGGQCEGTCVPDCTGKVCGSDGCSGSCGTCTGGLECQSNGTCGCGFFDTVTYTFTLDPSVTWPPDFDFVGLNVRHIAIDGTDEQADGAVLAFVADNNTFTFVVYGCRPKIQIKRDYALSGLACQSTQIITDRTTFIIPAPTLNPDGTCTSPPL